MRTGVTVEVDLVIGVGCCGGEYGVVGDEGVLIGRVGHHTHNHIVKVVGG